MEVGVLAGRTFECLANYPPQLLFLYMLYLNCPKIELCFHQIIHFWIFRLQGPSCYGKYQFISPALVFGLAESSLCKRLHVSYCLIWVPSWYLNNYLKCWKWQCRNKIAKEGKRRGKGKISKDHDFLIWGFIFHGCAPHTHKHTQSHIQPRDNSWTLADPKF